jgi:hypothetical protein
MFIFRVLNQKTQTKNITFRMKNTKNKLLHESGLESITLDADSTVKSVCGN